VTCHNLEASPSYSCPYSYYQKVQEYHNCYQHHVADDAASWENMKNGFVSQHTFNAASWENMKIGFVSQHTHNAAGWENTKIGCVMAHMMQLVGRKWKMFLCYGTVDAPAWENSKIGIVMAHRWCSWLGEYEKWFCVMAQLMQLVGRIGKLVLSWHTDDAGGWENMKNGFVLWHSWCSWLGE